MAVGNEERRVGKHGAQTAVTRQRVAAGQQQAWANDVVRQRRLRALAVGVVTRYARDYPGDTAFRGAVGRAIRGAQGES